MVCNKQLSTGEELYVIDENKFVCKEDYLSSGTIKEVSLNSGNSAAAPVDPKVLMNDEWHHCILFWCMGLSPDARWHHVCYYLD